MIDELDAFHRHLGSGGRHRYEQKKVFNGVRLFLMCTVYAVVTTRFVLKFGF